MQAQIERTFTELSPFVEYPFVKVRARVARVDVDHVADGLIRFCLHVNALVQVGLVQVWYQMVDGYFRCIQAGDAPPPARKKHNTQQKSQRVF